MLNYRTINNRNSSYYTRFFIIKFFYHIISPKQIHLFFCTFFRICPAIFEWWHGWRKRIMFKKQKFSLRVLDAACFFPSLVLLIKKRVVPSTCTHRRCSIKIGVLKKNWKIHRVSILMKLQNTSERRLL